MATAEGASPALWVAHAAAPHPRQQAFVRILPEA
jgi:hypothetical protein